MIGYRELAPSSSFRGAGRVLLDLDRPSAAGRGAWNRVLPDGCMDVIVNLGDATVDTAGGRNAMRAYVVGLMRNALRVRHTGRADLVGIRFRPGGAAVFFGVPARELTDTTAALEGVAGGAADLVSRAHDACDEGRAGGVARLRARLAVLESWLAARYRPGGSDPAVFSIAAALERSRGRARLAGLREPLGISERTLERRFAAQVGGSPAELRTAIRVRKAAARLGRDPAASLARLAV